MFRVVTKQRSFARKVIFVQHHAPPCQHRSFSSSLPDMHRNLAELETQGFTIVNDLFGPQEISLMQTDYQAIKSRAENIVASEPSRVRVWIENGEETTSRYWKCPNLDIGEQVILQAGEGRYDLWKGFKSGFFGSESIVRNARLDALMDQLLVRDWGQYNGVIMSRPGSCDQYFHRDTDQLSNKKDCGGAALQAVDDFYFTCLIPITADVTPLNGPTEFLVGSHRRLCCEFEGLKRAEVCVPVGSALLFNGKINHRGNGNRSDSDRPVIYSVYHKLWYNDQFRKGVE
mmetsp:Transcript_67917/g.136666  ORF Transcript_67917/g.136666 Transcript_67917/m.136666 type:complete len:287 (+) Transcript_67917:66-926(+)